MLVTQHSAHKRETAQTFTLGRQYLRGMLHEFISANRGELISSCRQKASKRFDSAKVPEAVDHGVPLFLEQLVDALKLARSTPEGAENDPLPTPAPTDIGRAAALQGADMLRVGYSVDQVVHGYGDICQAVTELAIELEEPISTIEFRVLNASLDNAIADAVTAYGNGHQAAVKEQADAMHDKLNDFSDDHRRLLDTAIMTFTAMQTGKVGLSGATGAAHLHSLIGLQSLVAGSLAEARKASALTTLRPGKLN